MTISIVNAELSGDYKLQLQFSDGSVRLIDFFGFLNNSRNPMTKKYLDTQNFNKFSIKYGDLNWNDFELCFPVWDLYQGKI